MKSFVKLPSEGQYLHSAASSNRRKIVRGGSKPRIFVAGWGIAALAALLLPGAVFARGGGGHGGGHHGGGHHAGGHHGEHHAGGHPGEHHAAGHGNHQFAAHHQWNHNGWQGNHDHWHNNWHQGYWGGWGAYPASWGAGYGGGGYANNGAGYVGGYGGYGAGLGVGVGLGAAAGLGLGYAYNNPYWSGDNGSTGTGYNYAQAIPSASSVAYGTGNGQTLASDTSDPQQIAAGATEGGTQLAEAGNGPQTIENPFAAEPTTHQQQALADMDTAREAFKQGDYARAEQFANKAVALLPDDTAVHEFRALTMFAQKKYRDAAAGIYAVLSTGPGWNEKTLQSLYADPKTYAGQLQALETYAKDNPQAADALFLLAYHELTAGKLDVARGELERVAQLEPKDKVATELVQALSVPRAATSGESSS